MPAKKKVAKKVVRRVAKKPVIPKRLHGENSELNQIFERFKRLAKMHSGNPECLWVLADRLDQTVLYTIQQEFLDCVLDLAKFLGPMQIHSLLTELPRLYGPPES